MANVCSLDSKRVSLTTWPSLSSARRNLLWEINVPFTDGASLAESIILVKLAFDGSNLKRDLGVLVLLLPFVEFKSAWRLARFVLAIVVCVDFLVLWVFTASLSESDTGARLFAPHLDSSGVDTFDELAFLVFERLFKLFGDTLLFWLFKLSLCMDKMDFLLAK